jgi:hypothetical protein
MSDDMAQTARGLHPSWAFRGELDGKVVSHWLLAMLAQSMQLSDGSIKRRIGMWG